MYLLLLSVIYLAFIGLGLPDSILGAAWPTVYAQWNVPISYMGIVSMIISLGTVVSGLLSERIIRRFGTWGVTVLSVGLTACALFGFSATERFYQMCLWAVPYGLGAGAVDAALNNYVALHYSSKHMSWLHCFWGVGTIVSPYMMSYALTHAHWTAGYRTIAYLQLAITAVLLLSLPLWKVNASARERQGGKELGLTGALKIKGVPYLLLGFFAYCAAEATAMLWASSYMEGLRGASKEQAAALGSLFFIGITVGRFLAGFITERCGDHCMIRIGTVTALAGVACILIPVDAVTVAGFVLLGLGCAPIYPCIIHSTPRHFGTQHSQGIIGIQMASAYIGSTFMPPVFGWMANRIGLQVMPFYLAFFLVLMWVMLDKTERLCRK